jgi:hypothetical protein
VPKEIKTSPATMRRRLSIRSVQGDGERSKMDMHARLPTMERRVPGS